VLADNFGTPTAMLVLAGILAVLAVWCTLARAPRLMNLKATEAPTRERSPADGEEVASDSQQG